MSAFVWCLCVDRDKQAFTCDVIDEDGWPHTFYLLEEAVGAGEELVVDYGAEYAPSPTGLFIVRYNALLIANQ